MKEAIEPFPSNIDRDQFGHWLSGFVDGEATFGLRVASTSGRSRPSFIALFRIATRDDEADTLQLIRSYWGCGTLHFSDNSRSKIANAKPVAIYGVQSVADLVSRVIPHFDRYPLRAKKRNDFSVWRQGVELMSSVQNRPTQYGPARGPNSHAGAYPKWTADEKKRFQSLALALRGQRQYLGNAAGTLAADGTVASPYHPLFKGDD